MFFKIIFNKKFSLLATIFICTIIFYFSHQTGEVSNSVSSSLFVRKLGHISEYLILAFFSCSYLTNLKNYKNSKILFLANITFIFFYAVSDEIHQTFILGRSGNIIDVFVDFTGGIIGTLLCLKIYKFFSEQNL